MSSALIERVGDARDETLERRISQSEQQAPAFVQTEMQRPRVHGKFLFVGDEKFWIRGVTYGTFKPDQSGVQFPPQDVVERDFRAIADAGLNAIRVYTAPPLWLMDVAAAFGLRVMIGLPWEQHVTFLDDRVRAERILSDMRKNVRRLAGHPAVLCYAVGNEIPASVVRWYGKARLERFIGGLRRSQIGRSWRAGHLCEFPHHRISRSAVSGFCRVQRLSGDEGSFELVPCSPAESRG